jgi:MoxR-like ATPase
MFNIRVTYPTPAEEAAIVKSTTTNTSATLEPIIKADELLRLQQLVRGVPVANQVVDYAVAISVYSRPELAQGKPADIHRYIRYGASPRASQYLILGAKARALTDGRYHVSFEDVRALAHPVLRHRILTNFRAESEGVTSDALIDELLKIVPLPKSGM